MESPSPSLSSLLPNLSIPTKDCDYPFYLIKFQQTYPFLFPNFPNYQTEEEKENFTYISNSFLANNVDVLSSMNFLNKETISLSDNDKEIQLPLEKNVISNYQIMYRNLFTQITCNLPIDQAILYEKKRIYIDENVAYTGNAKHCKKIPDKDEDALLLNCLILDPKDRPIEQCSTCKDYFQTQKYFKANPHCIGRFLLVKSNTVIEIKNGVFKITLKIMCCCPHHAVDYFQLQFILTEFLSNKIIFTSKAPVYVKKWRKTNQKKQDFSFNIH